MERSIIKNEQKALVIIDIQEDYTGKNAKSPFPYKNSDILIDKINKLAEKANSNNINIIYVKQEFEGFVGRLISRLLGHSTAIKGKAGTEFDNRLKFYSENIFSKPMPDAFTNIEFGLFLKMHEIKGLYLVGLDAAGCVLYTARGGIKNGYDVTIITDSIALKDESKWDTLMNQYKKENINLISKNEF